MSNEIMKKDYPKSQQRIAICLSESGKNKQGKSSLIEEIHDNLLASNCEWDDTWDVVVNKNFLFLKL
jgi:hypothetical protein